MSAQSQSSTVQERPPVVVVMGHVDHGKSTLLDFIRKSNTVDKEFGGITQHVAAYEVERIDRGGTRKRITFIDTPGHAAFSAIRARGANVADIAILVVAADDGVKAQTIEALQQIRDAGIPFIVAINKIDKPNANITRTQTSLIEQGVYLEKLGGDVPWTAISAKSGEGVDELLELILIVAELNEYTADPAAPAEGYVIEAHRDHKRGVAATLIITSGTLHAGTAIVAGHAIAPVRIMEDHAGRALKEATFSSPITLIGFDDLPTVGSNFHTFATKREAEAHREALAENIVTNMADAQPGRFYLSVIVRADTTGSLEAIAHELANVGDEYSAISIVQSGIGTISENDVKAALAGTDGAIVIGFNVGIDPIAEALARERGVTVETFNIIYKLTENLAARLEAARPRREVETIIGRLKVLKHFSRQHDEQLIGGALVEGSLAKGGAMRVMRRGEFRGTGKILSIQANKQTVDRIEEDRECGMQIVADFDIAPGDTIEQFTSAMQ